MAIIGSDPEAVEAIAAGIRAQVQQLRAVEQAVDASVEQTRWSWQSARAQDFADLWWQQYRVALRATVDGLNSLADSASRNAAEQRTVSGAGGTSGGGSGSAGIRQVGQPFVLSADGLKVATGVVGLGLFGRKANIVGRYTNRYKSTVLLLTGASEKAWSDRSNKLAEFAKYKRSGALAHLAQSPVLRSLDKIGTAGGPRLSALGKVLALDDGFQAARSAANHAAAGDGIGVGTDVADMGSIALKQSKNPVSYLAGVALRAASETVKEARQTDWNQGVPPPWEGDNWQKIWLPGLQDSGKPILGKLKDIFL